MAEGGEVERECRICRGEDEPGRPLLHPCRCSGSIKYTHEDCLVNWLAQSGSSRCELCSHSFRFEPLYQPNTPSALPTREFLVGILVRTNKTMKTAARIVLVFMVWLFFLPVGTCWTWYALFINSPSQLPALLASRGPAGVVTDAFYGCLLSAGIVFIFLGVSSLREYVRHFPQDGMGLNEEQGFDGFAHGDEIVPDDFEDYGSDEEVPLGAAVVPHGEGAGDGGIIEGGEHNTAGDVANDEYANGGREDEVVADDEVFAEVDELVRDTYDVIAGGDDSEEELGDDEDLLAAESDGEDNQLFEDRAANDDQNRLAEYDGRESDEEYDANGSDYMEDENGAAQPAPDQNVGGHVDDQHEAMGNEAMELDEGDDHDGGGEGGPLFGLFELDPDDVPLEEVVGLRGHIRNLFDNAGTVLVSNAIFLGVFTLIPLLIGRLTLRLFALRSFPLRITVSYEDSFMQALLTSFLPGSESGFKLGVAKAAKNVTATVGNASEVISGATEGLQVSSMVDRLAPVQEGISAASDSSLHGAGVTSTTDVEQPLVSYLDNFLIVLLGYGMIAFVAVGYIGFISMLRKRYPRLDSPITRQVARLLRYVATFVKIVVLILFEFGIFPLGCGWWLDICTLEILGGSLQSRVAYCQDSPWTCTGGHWIMGIVYMVHISLFISLLREVVKPQLLWFLRNPDDPEFHPFRELVEKPLSRHARRMCISVIIYVPLILALVYAPSQLCLKLLPHVFPFRSEDFSHILIDVPFGNLLVGPLIRLLYFGRPGISLHNIVATWIKCVSNALGIAHLVVKDENDGGDQGQNQAVNGNHIDQNIEGLEPGDGGPLQRMFGDQDEEVFDAAIDGTNLASRHEFEGEGIFTDETGMSKRDVRIRGFIMIVLAWLTLILAESAIIAAPTILGRSLMSAVGLPVRHDLHPFLLGLNVLFGSMTGVVKIVNYVKTVDTVTALSLGLPYLYLAGKGLFIVNIWLGVIPLASGLLFELILVPIRVSHDETPYFCLHQDWALGLLLLKVWTCIAVTGGLGAKWRERVLRAREGDLMGLNENFSRTMRELVLPVLISVLTALSVPYSFARGLLPMLGAARWVSNLVYRYAYLVITCLYCGFEALRYSVSILRDLHDSIRDDKYLVGKRLYNFIEGPETTATPQ